MQISVKFALNCHTSYPAWLNDLISYVISCLVGGMRNILYHFSKCKQCLLNMWELQNFKIDKKKYPSQKWLQLTNLFSLIELISTLFGYLFIFFFLNWFLEMFLIFLLLHKCGFFFYYKAIETNERKLRPFFVQMLGNTPTCMQYFNGE